MLNFLSTTLCHLNLLTLSKKEILKQKSSSLHGHAVLYPLVSCQLSTLHYPLSKSKKAQKYLEDNNNKKNSMIKHMEKCYHFDIA